MDVEIACQASWAGNFGRPDCPRCGSVLLVAEQSAFNLNGGIRHDWACDDCGEEFATSIRVLPPQA
jgi:DNA-directed RNA polymerase subunit M/transcription elongation factor TFIIS